MIFLTLGTYPLPFDRLLGAVDGMCQKGIITEDIFAQIGYSNYIPKHFRYERLLDKEVFDEILATSSVLIGHAGMGTITLALEHMKPLLVIPRLKKYGEHVNDHQLGTSRKFEELGHVLSAYDIQELPSKIQQLQSFVPKPRISHADQVAARINLFLQSM